MSSRKKNSKKKQNSKRTARRQQADPKKIALFFFLIILIVLTLLLYSVSKFINASKKFSTNATTSATPTPLPTGPMVGSIKVDPNAKNIDFTISPDSIQPASTTVTKGQDYFFRIVKDVNATCDDLVNDELGYSLQLFGQASKFPLTFSSSGTYTFKCYSSNLKFTVVVK